MISKNGQFQKGIAYLFIVLSLVGVFYFSFHPLWLKNLPEMKIYQGQLSFSGKQAYDQLKYLTHNFPDRYTGSKNDHESAKWLNDEFLKLGLDSKIESFKKMKNKFYLLGKPTPPNYPKDQVNIMVEENNVVAISLGQSEKVVVIGAHRDVVGEIQGAEDNGSGTVTLLELARVLSSGQHYYTYVFASFDGEEVGKDGSIDFVKRHGGMPIEMAYIVDMTGYSRAKNLGMYAYISRDSAVPLWTMALKNSVQKRWNLEQVDFTALYGSPKLYTYPPSNTLNVFKEIFLSRLFGHINTDSASFSKKNIPAIGVFAGGDPQEDPATIHDEGDVITQVSAQTLEMLGKFSEQYIKSIELNSLGGLLSSQYYYISGDQYISPVNCIIFFICIYSLVLVLVVLSLKSSGLKAKTYLKSLGREKGYLWMPLGVSPLFGLFVKFYIMFKMDEQHRLQAIVLGGLCLMGIAAIVLRSIYVRLKKQNPENEFGLENESLSIDHIQGLVVNTMLLLITILLLAVLGPIKAICLTILPILFFSHIVGKTTSSRIFWGILYVLSFVAEWKIYRGLFPQLFETKSMLALSIWILLWVYPLIYFAVGVMRSRLHRRCF